MYIPCEHPEYALATIGLDSATLAARPGVAVVEIAGRDSIAAAISAVRERGFTTLLPTSVATGTEYGDESAPEIAVERLSHVLGPDVEILPPLRLGSPRLWAALNGRFATVLMERYRLFSPCLACHLYMHLARVPLSLAIGSVPVIAGEREAHGTRVKLSQTPLGIDACIRVLARAGVELLEPLRRVHDSEAVAVLVGDAWSPGSRQLGCVLSGNYAQLDGSTVYDELAYARYVRGFLEPAGVVVVDAWRETAEPDYESIIRGVLDGPSAA
jgi:hypothetical protein